MRFTAASLRQKNHKRTLVKEHVKSIIIAFEQDIINASENRLEACQIRVPSEFNIPGLSNANAQLYIYTEVIYELEQHGFKVSIDMDTRIWTVSGWDILTEDKLNKDMVEILASRIERKQISSKNKSNK